MAKALQAGEPSDPGLRARARDPGWLSQSPHQGPNASSRWGRTRSAKWASLLGGPREVPRTPAARRFRASSLSPPSSPPAHLVHQPCDEHVPAHGCVLVQEAGALLATLVLPQQARLVNHPAEGNGPWDAPCGERPTQNPNMALRKGTSATGVPRGGSKGASLFLLWGLSCRPGFPCDHRPPGSFCVSEKAPSGQKVTWVPLAER